MMVQLLSVYPPGFMSRREQYVYTVAHKNVADSS